jgi:multidrug resistance efflux pump
VTIARVWRVFKLALGASLVASGVVILYRHFFVSQAERAILGRPLVVLRTPINGSVQKANVVEGSVLGPDAEVFEIYDPRAEVWKASELAERQQALQGTLAAMESTLTELDELRRGHKDSELQSREVQRIQLRSQLADARAAELAGRAQAAKSASQLARSVSLQADGIAAVQDLEQATAQQQVAEAGLRQATNQTEALTSLLRAISSGTPVDTAAGVGFSYSRQRSDELTVALVTRHEEVEQQRAQLRAVEAQLEQEKRRAELRQRSSPRFGKRVRVWRRLVGLQDYVSAGQPLAEGLDCSQAFVSALVYIRHAEKLRVGSRARVELNGNGTEYSGQIVTIGALAEGTTSLAPALPEPMPLIGKSDELVPVTVRLDAPAKLPLETCEAGTNARVFFSP